MTQLDLFEWAKYNSKLNDLGGQCSCCLESTNWLTEDEFTDYGEEESLTTRVLSCQTPRLDLDTGEFVELCLNHVNQYTYGDT